jgi:hypothetical protein
MKGKLKIYGVGNWEIKELNDIEMVLDGLKLKEKGG